MTLIVVFLALEPVVLFFAIWAALAVSRPGPTRRKLINSGEYSLFKLPVSQRYSGSYTGSTLLNPV